MNCKDFNNYKTILTTQLEEFDKQIKVWAEKVERTKKGSDKQKEFWLSKEIKTLEDLKAVRESFVQLVRVLKEEVESNELLQMAQAEEIVKLTETVDLWEKKKKGILAAIVAGEAVNSIVRLGAVNNSISKMIIEQDLN